MNYLISSEKLKKELKNFPRNSDDKITVILGAGASAGYSRNNHYLMPPVVSELFDIKNLLVKRVIQRHVSIENERGYIERSIKGFDNDLEAYLSDIYTRNRTDGIFSRILRYLEDIFTEASTECDLDDNHYKSLVRRIHEIKGENPWSILSFNYDTILEKSIVDLPRFIPPRTFNNDEDYLRPKPGTGPKVIKMHGGVNLRYISIAEKENIDKNIALHQVFSRMMNDKKPINDYLDIMGLGEDIPRFIGYGESKGGESVKMYDFPLMMIPIHTHTKIENSFFDRQIQLAKEEIAQSKLIIAIGYRFGDDTFINALKDLELKDSKLIIVCSKNTLVKNVESTAYKNASKVWPKENIYIYEGEGFGAFVDGLH